MKLIATGCIKLIMYVLLLLFSVNTNAQSLNEKAIDSLVCAIKCQNLEVKKTVTTDTSVSNYYFLDTYYVDSIGNLIVFVSNTKGELLAGKKPLYSETKYYFKNDVLIKIEISRHIPGFNPNLTSYYFFKGVKYARQEKEFRSYINGKVKSILSTFYN